MHYLDYHEQRQHRTNDFPLGYYYVDDKNPRYHMPMHWHKETEVIRVLSGRLRIYVDDSELLVQKGDLLTIGGGVIHGGDPENCVYECIVYDPQALLPGIESCKQAIQPMIRHNIYLKNRSIEPDFEFCTSVKNLFSIAATGFKGRELEMLSTIFNFLNGQYRNIDRAQLHSVSERTWQKAEQLKPALEYIEQHFGQHISLETLARLTGFSPKYFCRYFRAIVHRSPIDYLNYYRIECAAHCLTTADMNVAEVAVHCGYADSSAFIKQFRKYKGITPKRYKQQMTGGSHPEVKANPS